MVGLNKTVEILFHRVRNISKYQLDTRLQDTYLLILYNLQVAGLTDLAVLGSVVCVKTRSRLIFC